MDRKNTAKKKKRRLWVGGLFLFLLTLVVIVPLLRANAGSAPVEVAGKVVSVNVADTLDISGSLQAQPFSSLTWNTSGVVEDVSVEAGTAVKAGDVLMKLNESSVQSSILSAQGQLVTAQQELDDLLTSTDQDVAQAVIDLKDAQEAYDKADQYLKYLQTSQRVKQTKVKIFIEEHFGDWQMRYKTRIVKGPAPEDWIIDAQNDFDLKKAQLEDDQRAYDRIKDGPNAQDMQAAQAKIDAAQATLNSMSIIAPFDGEILYVESQPGDVIDSGSIAIEMADLNHLYIEAQVGEADVVKISVGDPIKATLTSESRLVMTGSVSAIDQLGDVVDGQVQYTIRMDLDALATDISVPLGSTASVTVQVGPETGSLAVPIVAIQNDETGEYVLVMQADGSTKRVDVVSSTIVNDLVAVTGDLHEGDTLATSTGGGTRPAGPFGRGN
jgi:HlyD family secretion protein